MNFNFYLFGTPNGYSQYPLDNTSQIFQDFKKIEVFGSQLSIHRNGHLVHYIYYRNLSAQNPNDYIGLCLVFNGLFCTDNKFLFECFEKAFIDIVMRGKIVFLEQNGIIKYNVKKIADEIIEINDIHQNFQNLVSDEFKRYFFPIDDSFRNNYDTKNVTYESIDDTTKTDIKKHNTVHIVKSIEKGLELAGFHKMLSDIYSDKQILTKKYNHLLGEKKQYARIATISFVVICCLLCIGLFNKNLQSKSSKIKFLESQLKISKDSLVAKDRKIHKLEFNQSLTEQQVKILKETIKLRDMTISRKSK